MSGDGPEGEGPPSVAAGLTTGAVARRLGVSPTTLRSWDRRYGIGPAPHAGGTHRRWTPSDIAVLETMCRLTSTGVPPSEAARAALAKRDVGGPVPAQASAAAPRPVVPALPSPATETPLDPAVRCTSRGLARAAARLDAQAVEQVLTTVIAADGLEPAWNRVIMPALHAVGRRWEASGDRYVEVEHLLSWHVSTALRRITPAVSERLGHAPVLLACVPDEAHTLALEALTAGLAQRGLAVRMFGAALPAQALEEAARRTGPAAIVLWAQSRSHASRPLAHHIGSLTWGVRGARHHSTVLVAGPGWSGPPVPGTLRPTSLTQAIGMIVSLCAP